ncbi:MAG: hypothetical protein GX683_06350 [Ruminococcaceae bacterium]|nr:hypothetical protein [Oscillospiraceae bacterium]
MVGRVLKKLLTFCLPFVFALALFVAFEPNNYWLLRADDDIWYMSKALNSTRRLQSGECENIILGNSLMANMNERYIEETSGIDFDVLAYGGATLNESIDEFWYAAEYCNLKRVVIGTNFYTMNNEMYQKQRYPDTIELAQQPLEFVGDFNYWQDAAKNLLIKLSALIARVTKTEPVVPPMENPSEAGVNDSIDAFAVYDADGERQDIREYTDLIKSTCADYRMGWDYIDKLTEVADYCEENGIELTIVLFGSNHAMWENVILPMGIDSYINVYKDALKSVATVYDFEFLNDTAYNDNVFLDGMHRTTAEKQRICRVIFAGEADADCMVTTKEEYLESK